MKHCRDHPAAQQEREPYIDLAEGKPVDKQRYLTDPVYHAIVYRLMRPAQQERERLLERVEAEWYNGNVTESAHARILDPRPTLADPEDAETPQEALAQALHEWECQGQPCTIMGSHQASASAILNAGFGLFIEEQRTQVANTLHNHAHEDHDCDTDSTNAFGY
jgi:hypothetical protein